MYKISRLFHISYMWIFIIWVRHLWSNAWVYSEIMCLLYSISSAHNLCFRFSLPSGYYLMKTHCFFVIWRLTRDKPATYFEPTARALALDQAKIYYRLISHSCFLQIWRNVWLNDNLQLRSKILFNLLCFPWLSPSLHHKMCFREQSKVGKSAQISTLCFAFSIFRRILLLHSMMLQSSFKGHFLQSWYWEW